MWLLVEAIKSQTRPRPDLLSRVGSSRTRIKSEQTFGVLVADVNQAAAIQCYREIDHIVHFRFFAEADRST